MPEQSLDNVLQRLASLMIKYSIAEYQGYVRKQQGRRSYRIFGGFSRYGPQTWHERIWGAVNPAYKPQVTFGTGRRGADRYLTNSFTADFYNPDEGIVIEIDGDTHDLPTQRTADLAKIQFFADRGITVYHISNADVELGATLSIKIALLLCADRALATGEPVSLSATARDYVRAVLALDGETTRVCPAENPDVADIWALVNGGEKA